MDLVDLKEVALFSLTCSAWKDRAESRFSKIPAPKSDYEKKSLRVGDDVSHRAPLWLAMYGIL